MKHYLIITKLMTVKTPNQIQTLSIERPPNINPLILSKPFRVYRCTSLKFSIIDFFCCNYKSLHFRELFLQYLVYIQDQNHHRLCGFQANIFFLFQYFLLFQNSMHFVQIILESSPIMQNKKIKIKIKKSYNIYIFF